MKAAHEIDLGRTKALFYLNYYCCSAILLTL